MSKKEGAYHNPADEEDDGPGGERAFSGHAPRYEDDDSEAKAAKAAYWKAKDAELMSKHAGRKLGEAVSAKDLVKTSDREYKIGQYVLSKFQGKFDVFVRPDPDEYGVKLTAKPLSLRDAVELVKADAKRKPGRLSGSHTAAPVPKRLPWQKKSLRLDDFLD